eukprot:6467213-Amphidinium_carterae.1
MMMMTTTTTTTITTVLNLAARCACELLVLAVVCRMHCDSTAGLVHRHDTASGDSQLTSHEFMRHGKQLRVSTLARLCVCVYGGCVASDADDGVGIVLAASVAVGRA